MKKMAISIALFGLLNISLASHAALTPSADGKLIYDSDLNLTWLADANYSKSSGYHSTGLMTWNEANNTWAANLTFQGNSDWRLPTVSEMEHLRNDELGGSSNNNLFNSHNSNFNLFSNLNNSSWYWTSTEAPNDATKAIAFYLGGDSQSLEPKTSGSYAMAVSAVPEPETYAMFLAGLGLLGWRMRNARS
jgi:hypothetical protein